MSVQDRASARFAAAWVSYGGVLGAYLRPQWRKAALLAVLLLGSIALQLANPQIIGRFLDAAQSGADQRALALAGIAFIVIGLLQRGVALGAVYVGENVAWSATNALRADLTRHCLRLDMPFHKQHTPGELIERIDGDSAALGNFFSQFTIRLLGNALLVAGVVLLLWRADWRLGLGMAAYAGATFLALGALQHLAVARSRADRQAFADLSGFLEERYNGLEDIRSSGAEAYALDGFYRLLRAVLQKGRAARMFNTLTTTGTGALFLLGYAFGLALAAYLYSAGAVSIGAAYLVVYYVGMIAAPLENVRAQMQDLGAARASLARANEFFALRSALADRGSARLPAGPLSVELAGVSFAYDDGADGDRRWPAENGDLPEKSGGLAVAAAEHSEAGGQPATEDAAERAQSRTFAVRDVSFCLPPGQVLGLLGRTGSGKTTLSRLLFRLYDPAAGALRLQGIEVRDVPLDELRARVGVITQDVQLFQASIRDNLTFFDRRIGDERIEAALRELGLWGWVEGLPAGMDTPLGAGGQGLSAGEAQLLAFARVFLRDPGLIVLDEASARIDPATEALLERAVGRLLHGRTGIIIAHRLHTVQRADNILIMEDGRVGEYGPRAVLAADPASRFARLLRAGLGEALA